MHHFNSFHFFILCFSYQGMDGEPGLPEYRVPFTFDDKSGGEDELPKINGPVEEDDNKVVLRVESARNVVVYSVMFVRTSVLQNHELNFKESSKIFKK